MLSGGSLQKDDLQHQTTGEESGRGLASMQQAAAQGMGNLNIHLSPATNRVSSGFPELLPLAMWSPISLSRGLGAAVYRTASTRSSTKGTNDRNVLPGQFCLAHLSHGSPFNRSQGPLKK